MIIDELDEFKTYISKRYLKIKQEFLSDSKNIKDEEIREYRAKILTLRKLIFEDCHEILTNYLSNSEVIEKRSYDITKGLNAIKAHTKNIKNESTLIYMFSFIFLKIEYILMNYTVNSQKDFLITDKQKEEISEISDIIKKYVTNLEGKLEKDIDNKDIIYTYLEIIKYYDVINELNLKIEKLSDEEKNNYQKINDHVLKEIAKHGNFGRQILKVVKALDTRYEGLEVEEVVVEKKYATFLETFKKFNSSFIKDDTRKDMYDYNDKFSFIVLVIIMLMLLLAYIFA